MPRQLIIPNAMSVRPSVIPVRPSVIPVRPSVIQFCDKVELKDPSAAVMIEEKLEALQQGVVDSSIRQEIENKFFQDAHIAHDAHIAPAPAPAQAHEPLDGISCADCAIAAQNAVYKYMKLPRK